MIAVQLDPRDQLKAWILSTPEAERARDAIPSETELRELCETDPSLRAQMVEHNVSSRDVAREMFRSEWLRATLREAVSTVSPPTHSELRSFYARHPERWATPETRKLAHVLITVQDGYAENTEDAARVRIDAIRTRVSQGEDFGRLAEENSECPTALERGDLGWVRQGQLFPELEAAAFRLREGEMSVPIRSELGWHLLVCQEIKPEGYHSFESVQEKLRAALFERRRIAAQKRWVSELAKTRHHAD